MGRGEGLRDFENSEGGDLLHMTGTVQMVSSASHISAHIQGVSELREPELSEQMEVMSETRCSDSPLLLSLFWMSMPGRNSHRVNVLLQKRETETERQKVHYVWLQIKKI